VCLNNRETLAYDTTTRAKLVDTCLHNLSATIVVTMVTAFQQNRETAHQIDPLLTVRAITYAGVG
jgi:hypothetical protein